MKQGSAFRYALIACVVACCVALAGCAGGQSPSATDEQKANSAYMLQVNEIMAELDDSLELFVAAVSRGDVVNMRTQADEAYKSLDKLAKLEAPEALKDIKQNYVDGTNKLREALDAYIDLYGKLASSDSSIDKTEYDEEIAKIQGLYDEGIAALQKADELANPEGASASSESSTSSASSSAASGEFSQMAAPSSESASSSAAA